MIETENQRRWWFATHPEFSSSQRGTRGSKPARRDSPLTYNLGLKDGIKWALGPNRSPRPPFIMNPDYMAGFYDGVEEAKSEYWKGWGAGYGAIHNGKVPPDPARNDKSAYAQGVREGATAALDEQAAWQQKWFEGFPFLYGSHHSRTLGRNLEKDGELRPSRYDDAHHIVAWNHWRAGPARDILDKWGIHIDDAVNGVWLPRAYHQTLNNSKEYYDAVNKMLAKATSKKEVLETLQRIKHRLSVGRFP